MIEEERNMTVEEKNTTMEETIIEEESDMTVEESMIEEEKKNKAFGKKDGKKKAEMKPAGVLPKGKGVNKAKMKKYKDKPAEALSVIIDTKGSKKKEKRKKSWKRASMQSFGSKISFEDVKNRERTLALDLFGDNVDDPEYDISENINIPYIETTVKTEDDISDESKLPDDPFDIHNLKVEESVSRKPAWIDEEDETTRVKDVVATFSKVRGSRGVRETSEKLYEKELKEKFNQVIGSTPEWADLDYKPKDEDEDEMDKTTGSYLSDKSISLPKKRLEYKKMMDLNSSHTEGIFIEDIDFNPHMPVGLIAGFTKRIGAVTLYQVDGKTNHRIQSIRFPNVPLTCAKFLRDGRKFVAGSDKHNYFYMYDLESGKETKFFLKSKDTRIARKNLYVSPDGKSLIVLADKGQILVYDTTTFSHIDTLEAPFRITSATFNSDGSRMFTHGETGDVCVWDLEYRECIHRFYDDGCLSGSAITMSPSNQYLACGSKSGIVNIYDSSSVLTSSTPKPVKILSNLTTQISMAAFNPSSEILGICSEALPDSIKLVHFPSMGIFENFPPMRNNTKKINMLQFSPQTGFLAVGNKNGAAELYRLKHFAAY